MVDFYLVHELFKTLVASETLAPVGIRTHIPCYPGVSSSSSTFDVVFSHAFFQRAELMNLGVKAE